MNGLVRWLRTTSFGVSRGEVLFTSLLSLYAVVLVATQSTAGACLAALGMVVPVAFARRAPLAAAVTIAVATLANELLFRHLVRCGQRCPPRSLWPTQLAVGRLGQPGRSAWAACWPALPGNASTTPGLVGPSSP
jgi:hypothetical protein